DRWDELPLRREQEAVLLGSHAQSPFRGLGSVGASSGSRREISATSALPLDRPRPRAPGLRSGWNRAPQVSDQLAEPGGGLEAEFGAQQRAGARELPDRL